MANQTQIQILILGPDPQPIRCPFCRTEVVTLIKRRPSMKTHLVALLLFALGCWFCCCIPYFIDSCLVIEHTCPNCGNFIGSYSHQTC